MTWQDITVQQFQQLNEIWLASKGAEPFFIMADMVEVCYGMSRNQVDSLSTAEFNEHCRNLSFLDVQPDWKPVPFVEINGRRYRFVYDVRQIHAARNIEVKYFSGDFVQNMHKMAASMVVPQRRNTVLRWRWNDDKYDAAQHEQYANDLLQCPITAIHGSALFFCEVFTKLIADMSDSLISTLPTTEAKETAKLAIADLCRIMDGSTTPAQSPSWSGLP